MSVSQNQYSKKNRKSSLILVLLIILIGNCSSTYAQRVPQKIDSLLRIVPTVDDTTRILNYLKIAQYYADTSLSKGLYYSSLAYRESVRVKWIDGLIASLLKLADYFSLMNDKKQANTCIKFVLSISSFLPKDNTEILFAVASNFMAQTDYPKALKYYLKALYGASISNNYRIAAICCFRIASINIILKNYKKAEQNIQKGMLIAKWTDDKVRCYGYEALYFLNIKNENITNAKKCVDKIYAICKSAQYSIGLGFALILYGDLYARDSLTYRKALDCWGKAVAYELDSSCTITASHLYTRMAQVYTNSKMFNEALEYNKKSLELRLLAGQLMFIGSSYTNIGTSYKNMKKYIEAEIYIKKGLRYSKNISHYEYIIYNYRKLYELSVEKKDYKKALDYYLALEENERKFREINDLEKLSKIQSDYEVLRREKLLQAQTYQLTKSKQSMLLLILFTVVLTFTLLILFFFYRNNKRFSEQLEINVKARTVELEHEVEMRKLIESELVKAKEIAEKSNEAKNRFLATTSHEIRTPLNGILGFSNLLLNDDLSVQHREFIQIIHDSAGHLFDLIREIIDFSKIERGEIAFISDFFNLHEVIHSVEKVTKISHQDSKPDFYVKIEANVPEYLKGDEGRLRQVLFNLINNAFKFTEEGFVSLEVRSVESDLNKERIQFVVRDTGIGIVETEIKNIFKDFVQLNTDMNSTRKGMGLGLSICKQIVEGQNGEIRVDSEPGSGSRFIIELTFERVQGSLQKKDLLELEDLTSSSIRILYAEDKLVNAMVLQKYLMLQGVKVDIAENGEVALEMLERGTYDLVLMDIEMPVMDGYEATKAIRRLSDEKKRNIPVIALTAHALDEFEQKSYESGMNAFQTKPLQIESLMKVIRTFVAR